MSSRGGRCASATLVPDLLVGPSRISDANFFAALLGTALLPPDCFKAGCVFSLLATAMVTLGNGVRACSRTLASRLRRQNQSWRGAAVGLHWMAHNDPARASHAWGRRAHAEIVPSRLLWRANTNTGCESSVYVA
jgi:hypothetical protein